MDIPKELIGHILSFLDKKNSSRVAGVNKFFHEHYHWLRQCFTDKNCQLLIQDDLTADKLIAGEINPKIFYQAVQTNNIPVLKKLLFIEPVRRWILYIPLYQSRIPQEFHKPMMPRKLFLTAESGKQNVLNTDCVKQWLPVSVMVSVNDFEGLFRNRYIEYACKITSNDIIYPNAPIAPSISPRTTS